MAADEEPVQWSVQLGDLPRRSVLHSAGGIAYEYAAPFVALYAASVLATFSLAPTLFGVFLLLAVSSAVRFVISVLIGGAVMPSSRLTRTVIDALCTHVPSVASRAGLHSIHTQFALRDASLQSSAALLRDKCNGHQVLIRTALGHTVQATVCLPRGRELQRPALAGVVVHFGGNGQIAQLMPPAAVLRYTRLGFGLVLPNYRGVAGSTGLTTRRAAVLDAICVAVGSSMQLGVPLSQVVLEGHSIGGGFAAEAALALPHVHACLDRTFACLPDAAVATVVPWACRGVHVSSWLGWLARRAVAAAVRHGGDWGLSPLHALLQLAAARKLKGFGGTRMVLVESVSNDQIIPVPAQLGAQLQFNHSDVYAAMRKHGFVLDLSTLGADPHNRAYTEQEWQARVRHIREAVGF